MAYELFDFSSDKVRNPSFISCKPVNRSTIIKYDSLNSLLFLSRPSKKYLADPSLRFSVPRFNACSCATDAPRTCSITISTACYTKEREHERFNGPLLADNVPKHLNPHQNTNLRIATETEEKQRQRTYIQQRCPRLNNGVLTARYSIQTRGVLACIRRKGFLLPQRSTQETAFRVPLL